MGSIVIAGCCRTISETGSAKARRFESKSSCTSVSGKGNETSALVTTEGCQVYNFRALEPSLTFCNMQAELKRA